MTLAEKIKEKISFYFWRLKILLCNFKHDYVVDYTRVRMDGYYSGKQSCRRCYTDKYFSGRFMPDTINEGGAG